VAEFRSFKAQLSGFLDRPHEDMPRRPVDTPAAWRTHELSDWQWRFTLSEDTVRSLGDALDNALEAGVSMAALSAREVPVAGLAENVAAWREAIESGRGFAVVRGLPVTRWGERKSAYAFWLIGHYLGVPGEQNPQGELLGHVRDYDEYKDNPNVRRYRTAGNIDFHCDPADVVGLLCLQKAKSGGQSRIASSVAVVNALLEENPALVAPLFSTTAFDRRDEEPAGEPGYFEFRPCCHAGGRLRTFYHSEYFRSAARHFQPPELPAALKRSLDRFDALADSPDYRFDMWLEPGDMQFLSNHSIVHARTAYEDSPESGRQRHLLRLWLSLGG